MKDDAVKIALNEEEERSPQCPDWNKFWAIPTTSPHLREFITSVVWNAAKKTLHIEIAETPAFSAYEWFSKLSLFQKEDGPQQSIAVCFFNHEEREIARLLFHKLVLQDHTCVVSATDKDVRNELIHDITVSYHTVERIKATQQAPEQVHSKYDEEASKIADAEWEEKVDKEVVLS